MSAVVELQEPIELFPPRAAMYPQFRYMGNKYRLLPWIHEIISTIPFSSALDAFSGSGSVAYLFKAMGKRVVANDFLTFCHQIAVATVENQRQILDEGLSQALTRTNPRRRRFIERTFSGIFFTPEDLRFLDTVWSHLSQIKNRHVKGLALAALTRSCIKKQPRGVFTVSDPERYKDGRRDLRLSLQEHFIESVKIMNQLVFDNGEQSKATRTDVLKMRAPEVDLVYMDPPYVPRADDNCYIKRYHFLEGLASYWDDEAAEIMQTSKVRKLRKRFTPFSYRRTAQDAFDRMFKKFSDSTLVLSYSSNGYPDLSELRGLMQRYKRRVEVFERPHRYHFGTHNGVAKDRAVVREFLIIGS